jgi:hypothetical protein
VQIDDFPHIEGVWQPFSVMDRQSQPLVFGNRLTALNHWLPDTPLCQVILVRFMAQRPVLVAYWLAQ